MNLLNVEIEDADISWSPVSWNDISVGGLVLHNSLAGILGKVQQSDLTRHPTWLRIEAIGNPEEKSIPTSRNSPVVL